MTDDLDRKKKLPNLDIVDPAGIIRARARLLWQEDGSPADRDWSDYFTAAEAEMIGRPEGSKPVRPAARSAAKEQPSEMRQLADASSSFLVALLAASFPRRLDRHEAEGLGYLLLHNRIVLADGNSIEAHSIRRAAEVLSELAGEYESGFLERSQASAGWLAPLESRVEYWETILAETERKDEALTNLDRLTIQRIAHCLCSDKRVKEIKFVE